MSQRRAKSTKKAPAPPQPARRSVKLEPHQARELFASGQRLAALEAEARTAREHTDSLLRMLGIDMARVVGWSLNQETGMLEVMEA